MWVLPPGLMWFPWGYLPPGLCCDRAPAGNCDRGSGFVFSSLQSILLVTPQLTRRTSASVDWAYNMGIQHTNIDQTGIH